MDKNLIDPSIYCELVEVESCTRDSSSRIERILSDGIPLFAETIGCFSSNAEKYFIYTSNDELEERLQKDSKLLNNVEWDAIEGSLCNIAKHLEVLSNVTFCIQKAYCDNIQYINISQSYKMINNEKSKSLFSNEASKKELLLAISKRKSTLRPLINEINLERDIIPIRLLAHYEILSAINELLPVWNISLYQNLNAETPIHECSSSLNLQIRLTLPPLNLLTQKYEKNSTKLWTKIASICFEDLVLSLSFNDATSEPNLHSFKRKKFMRDFVYINAPETLMSLIDNDFELDVKFELGSPLDSFNRSSMVNENLVIPPSIKSKLSKQIHISLRRIHWKLIDRAVFHTLIQELVNIQKESKNHINISSLDSNEFSFSIDLQMLTNQDKAKKEKFQNIHVTLKQTNYPVNDCNLKRSESFATMLLREAFLEVWNEYLELNSVGLSDKFEDFSSSSVKSSIILDTWILKLQKYANLAHVPLLPE
ncbi:hypothetical protein RS030_213430 [Cryptosporidium xiaoi]|uniref:Mediator of RNA polymerase II transcription subunit 17 n=1 Tax=Cryptosporidium xiaoi TaxID=659607 RepID=A0AAV9XX70_9CRYT